jgi:hypothetical protein
MESDRRLHVGESGRMGFARIAAFIPYLFLVFLTTITAKAAM